MVVTGTFEPLSLEELDRAVRLLPVREQLPLLNTFSDLFRMEPSLDLQARAPNGVQGDLSIRGAGFGQTLVLLNGQRLNDVQSGHHNLDIPTPLESVSRIEVLRGSGSTMYGSDAVGGAVNIITSPPEDGLELRLRTAVGNFGTNQQRGSISAAKSGLSEQLTFSRDLSTGFRPDRDYRNLMLGSNTAWGSGGKTGGLTLAYMDHPFGADQFYGNYNSWEDTKTWFAGLRQNLGADTNAGFAYRRHSDLFVLYRDRPEVFTNHHSSESYQAALRRQDHVGIAGIFYGVEGLHESVESNNLGNHSRSRGAIYAAADFRALRRYSLSISAREEVYRNFSATLSPTISGAAWISPQFKLRASASRAFRIPGYTDLYYHDPANLGSPNLRPERAWTYEGGMDWIPSSRVRGDVTVFQRRQRDGIDYYRSSPTDIWRALNITNLNFTGVESSLRFAPRPSQTIDLRFSALHGTQDTIPVGFTKYTFNYPSQSAVVAWMGSFRGFAARSRLGVLNRRARDPYALWDLYAARTQGRLHPFIQLSNVTGTTYQEIQGVDMPGRSVIGGIELVIRKP